MKNIIILLFIFIAPSLYAQEKIYKVSYIHEFNGVKIKEEDKYISGYAKFKGNVVSIQSGGYDEVFYCSESSEKTESKGITVYMFDAVDSGGDKCLIAITGGNGRGSVSAIYKKGDDMMYLIFFYETN